MARPTISNLPPAPQRRSDPPEEFSNKADDFVDALDPFGQEQNDLGQWMDDTATDVKQDRDDTESYASSALGYRNEARDFANEDEDVEVIGNEYSAYHYAKKSEQYKDSAEAASDAVLSSSDTDFPSLVDKGNYALFAADTEDAVEWRGPATIQKNGVMSAADKSKLNGIEAGATVYTESDFDEDFSNKTTDDLTEGTSNLYYTSSKAKEDTLGNWQIITSNYTASSFERLLVDTSGGSVTVTLPANPSVGSWIRFADAASTWGDSSSSLSVDGNTKNILGSATYEKTTSDDPFSLVYTGSRWALG